MKIIVYCPNCKHKISTVGFTGDGAGIYRCSDCGKKWIIKEEKEGE